MDDLVVKLLEKQDDRLDGHDKRFENQDKIISGLDDAIRGRNGTPGMLEQGRRTLEIVEKLAQDFEVLSEEHKDNMRYCRERNQQTTTTTTQTETKTEVTDSPLHLTTDLLKALINNKKSLLAIISFVSTLIIALGTLLGVSNAKLNKVDKALEKVTSIVQTIQTEEEDAPNQ